MSEQAIKLPLQTEFDADASGESSIDPLGLYTWSERLSTDLVPGVRERMSNPRFLTLIAVSSVVCQEFLGRFASDDFSTPPYLVFEWHAVQGITLRSDGDTDVTKGLPGREKATRTLQKGLSLNTPRYLKTASVFGFTGIYRPLARHLELIHGESLGPWGVDLATVWEQENDLTGFISSTPGRGSSDRRLLAKAIDEALSKGEVTRSGQWAGWDFIAKYLQHTSCGKREAKTILDRILDKDGAKTKPILDFLSSPLGQKHWAEHQSEQQFHEALRRNADKQLTVLLDAIIAYEAFARSVQNAFDHVLLQLGNARSWLSLSELAELRGVQEAASKCGSALSQAVDAVSKHDQELARRLDQAFSFVSATTKPAEWLKGLLDFHRAHQGKKPPNGKKPWIVQDVANDRAHIDSTYIRGYEPHFDGRYVNFYRTRSLQSFLEVLRPSGRG